jgi:hypothetical protein
MFRKLRKAKEQLATVNHYFEYTVDHLEENKNAYMAGAAGFLGGALIVSALKSKPVVVNTTINLCNHQF